MCVASTVLECVVRRLFLDVRNVGQSNMQLAQLHVREHGRGGVPLVMLHAAPGSALMLSRLQEKFTQQTWAIDLPGMGDSSPLNTTAEEPSIDDFARPIAQTLNTLLTQYDVYGTLSGVRVALALANASGSHVRRVVLDGIGIPKPEQLAELLEDYAPVFAPDINGTHLLSTFQLCRDQYLFYPWYARDAEHRRPNGLPDAAALHTKTMESLKSAATFRPLIRAAFRYDVAGAMQALKQAALITADGAAARPDLPLLEFPPAEPLTCANDLLEKRAARIQAFLA
jgi:pimeloyl-ACP methyl ester carboxylesterase